MTGAAGQIGSVNRFERRTRRAQARRRGNPAKPDHHPLAKLFVLCAGTLLTLAPASAAESVGTPPKEQSKCEIATNKLAVRWFRNHEYPDIFNPNSPMFSRWRGDPPNPPQAYLDPISGISFRVESDGRHVDAIDKDGKRLWVRNPFVDANLCPYRSAHPFIVWIGAPGGEFNYAYKVPKPFDPVPDKTILKMLNDMRLRQHMERLPEGSRFIGLVFDSSQMGYVAIATGDFYFMGQN